MSHKIRMFLYIVNRLISIVALVGLVAALVMVVVEPEEWLTWIVRGGISVVIYVLAKVISIFRKSKFPIPGIDYY